MITESHHFVEHDYECCYVYHRTLWLISLVLVLLSIGATVVVLMSENWLKAPGSSSDYYYDYWTSYETVTVTARMRRSPANAATSQPDGGGEIE